MTKIDRRIKYPVNLSLGRIYVENKNRKFEFELLGKIFSSKVWGSFMYTKLFRLVLIEFIA